MKIQCCVIQVPAGGGGGGGAVAAASGGAAAPAAEEKKEEKEEEKVRDFPVISVILDTNRLSRKSLTRTWASVCSISIHHMYLKCTVISRIVPELRMYNAGGGGSNRHVDNVLAGGPIECSQRRCGSHIPCGFPLKLHHRTYFTP